MPRPTYIDVHPSYDGRDTYVCTNEEAAAYRYLLGTRKFTQTGAIASTGDIIFSTLLPISERIYAVDHNTAAIAVAMIKAILLDKMGVRAFKGLILEKEYAAFDKAYREALPELPEPLKEKPILVSSHAFGELRREWINYPDSVLNRARRKLDAVTFIHGDLRDLTQFGPMDLLYASNACEHTNRDRTGLTLEHLAPLVREDGLLLQASSTGYKRHDEPQFWQHSQRFLATRLNWHYDLFVRKTPPPMIAPIVEEAHGVS